MSVSSDHSACPSSGCQPGAVVVGIVLRDGRIAYASDRMEVDEDFVSIAHEGRAPERRFRFSMPCMGKGCAQWNGLECGLIDRLLADYRRQFGEPRTPDPLPACPIREECRWFRQRDGKACAVCNVLVTDAGLTDAELPREVARRRRLLATNKRREGD